VIPAAQPRATAASPGFPPVIPAGARPVELARASRAAHETAADAPTPAPAARALAAAKSIDDISNSMAETLFGEADLDMLSAALGSTWPETRPETTNAPPAPPAPPKDAPSKDLLAESEDPFDLFGLGPDAPLELIDDSTPDADGRKAVNNR
jgi:hypothetical protein